MKFADKLTRSGLAAAVILTAVSLSAQETPPPPPPAAPPPAAGGAPAPGGDRGGNRGDRGRFDPAEIQKRIMESYKERLEFKDDAEWAAVQPLVQKVMDARREVMVSGMGGMFRFGRRGGDRDNRSSAVSSFLGAPSPEAEALHKALDDNAPAAQVKAALEKFRAAQKEKEAKLTAAQEELRKVLTVRQEALATLNGLLP